MIVVVGGHTRNIGKTSLAAGIVAAFPEMHWTAFKITQFGHGVCSADGEACDCETDDHTIAISEERDAQSGTDTSRMLAAGAQKVYWARTRQGQLAEAMPLLRKRMGEAENVLLESNSVLRFLKPDLYLAVLDPSIADFKPSALRYLDRADAIVFPQREGESIAETGSIWPEISDAIWNRKPRFVVRIQAEGAGPDLFLSSDLKAFVAERLPKAA
ncbi:hypothetical protein [Terriglobus saanensis]|uniref:Uncharacterized protein n=1 Tax=Terriglobus saanensis (strain ATCC BAA-1853 / DSM 23119 / SP1PR4) TaxID=401053 RepID=E8UZC4_TERSS|nr:hypothetical protein [Terriglobus saanensis]ADV82142.1 hypothetical protein AciPR4_1318 [Terriglobus saanensis SP1PR4]